MQARTAEAGGTAVYSATDTRDAAGRIVQTTCSVEGESHTWAFTCDDAGRLTQVTRDGTPVHIHQYGPTGPSGTITATYDDRDRLVQYGNTDYTYNAAGDLTQTSGPQGTTSYDYDAFGNLRGATQPDGTKITYVIDGENRRVGKKVDGTLEQGWLYQDGLNPVAQTDGQGNVTERFVYGTKPNVPAYMIKDGTTYRFITDPRGSVRLVVNADTGEIAQRIDYSPFGKVVNDTNPGFQPFGFAGGLYDLDTGLVRFGARDYDPETGRWTAKDPIGFLGGTANLYQYAVTDPVNYLDLSGNDPALVCGAIVVAAVAYLSWDFYHNRVEAVHKIEKAKEINRAAGNALKTGEYSDYARLSYDASLRTLEAARAATRAGLSVPGTFASGPVPTNALDAAVSGATAAAQSAAQ